MITLFSLCDCLAATKRPKLKLYMQQQFSTAPRTLGHYRNIVLFILLLGPVALGVQRPIVIKLSRGRSVALCVQLSFCPVHCGKTANQIRIPFGIIDRTGPGMRQVVGFGDQSTGRGTFAGEFGARHCNHWGLTFTVTQPSSQITLDRRVIISMMRV